MKKQHTIWLSMLCLCAILLAESDTTRSNTRLVPKKSDHGRVIVRDSSEDNSDDCSFIGCLVGELFKIIFVESAKAFFTTDEITEPFASKKLSLGLGITPLSYVIYPKASATYTLQLNGDLFFSINEHLTLREHVGIRLSPIGSVLADFERDVYVNQRIIGQEKDSGELYQHFSFPLLTELLVRPGGDAGSLFFMIGAGPCFVYEKLKGTRSFTYQNTKQPITVTDKDWIPTFSLGIGKFFSYDRPFGSLEFRYTLGINDNRKVYSLPGDNTSFVHGIAAFQMQFIF